LVDCVCNWDCHKSVTFAYVDIADVWENLFNVSIEEFFSKKITNKLVQQLQVACVRRYVLVVSVDRICGTWWLF